ncbi:putative 3-oxoacyl-(acyl-carrier-protein) reductase [Pusillimonas sp. T7-7]|uniref:SDR family NAD(P)-dependent oxidoreductase n=1 Tax=Pusillimonas sp. (strain T7-7) TaxID=1007105 RepID=UPI0002084379|nr:SDR family NAD(P)-dependent oxidoreductase [Pusillimonas sp. T7-7]AEC21474.1 putative 3-oxoacyl-(acyl-carrier-protein) reductase [Pusillimonas sp. T7-7]
MKLENKVVLMAGAGSSAPGWSIGKASCVTLARHGAVIVALDASLDAAQDAAEEVRKVGGKALAVQADVTDQAAVGQAIALATHEFGGIDVYVANAGIGKIGGVAETQTADLDRVYQVNVQSLLTAAKLVIPGMVQRGGGSIVTISSVAGIRYLGYPHLAYGVTKAALIQFTRMIAHEYAADGIRANTVVPGLIDTPRIQKNVSSAFSKDNDADEVRNKRNQQVPMQRMGTPWEVANAIAFLASDEASYITGTELIVDGGLTGKF